MTTINEADQLEKLAEDVPKWQALLASLEQQADSVTARVEEVLRRVIDGEISTSNGVSLLDVKNNTMLAYLLDLVGIVNSKVNGVSIRDSGFVNRVIESRTVLEKIAPLEHKLRYQIDKAVQSASSGNHVENDPLSFKPNLDDFAGGEEESDEEVGEAEETKKYVPPHIAAMKYDEQETKGKGEREMEKLRERTLRKSSLISELAQESTDAPLEISHHSSVKNKVVRDREERQRFEEDYFTRLNVSKKQKNAERELIRRSELDSLTKFGNISALDDRADLSKLTKKRKSKSKGFAKKSKKRKFKL
uniref:neuroguidin-like n=1 Tax=Ciona intestinalis TaxID=7719 RepID=UPI000180CD3A|nr:neuroguidin-like [Ciona intestinalis]|eukprot:XP_002131175.1 neuroguidin-like [Ciona intestinalis]